MERFPTAPANPASTSAPAVVRFTAPADDTDSPSGPATFTSWWTTPASSTATPRAGARRVLLDPGAPDAAGRDQRDFVVGIGRDLSYGNDSAGLTATIEQGPDGTPIPLPVAGALTALGLAAIAIPCARRRRWFGRAG